MFVPWIQSHVRLPPCLAPEVVPGTSWHGTSVLKGDDEREGPILTHRLTRDPRVATLRTNALQEASPLWTQRSGQRFALIEMLPYDPSEMHITMIVHNSLKSFKMELVSNQVDGAWTIYAESPAFNSLAEGGSSCHSRQRGRGPDPWSTQSKKRLVELPCSSLRVVLNG
ncbi:unnamed protein product, partial [Cyprideis torosa]